MKGRLSKGVSSPSKFSAALAPFLLVAILALLPLLEPGSETIRLLFVTFVWVTVSVAWNLLGGFGGQVSFGFAVFYGLGAYAAALSLNDGIHPFFSFVLAGIAASAASLLVGLPTFRLKGPYFAIATIGVSEAVRVVMTNLAVTGGASGYRIVERTRFNQREHFYTAVAVAAAALIVSYSVFKSKF